MGFPCYCLFVILWRRTNNK